MAVLLFRLRHVPEDEADEVRELLRLHGIDFYETSAGNWQISMPAIWLTDDGQLPQAQRLLEEYQQQRFQRAREEYESLRREGRQPTATGLFRDNPLRFIAYSSLIAVILYLSLRLFPGL